MIIRRHHFHISLVSLTAGLITCLLLITTKMVGIPQAITVTTCSPSLSLTQPLNNATLAGSVNFEVTNNSGTIIKGVDFVVDGQTVAGTTSPTDIYWRIAFNTTTVPNGPHVVSAVVYDSANTMCKTNAVNVNVQNATQVDNELVISASQTSWQGPTNFPYNFMVKAALLRDGNYQDVTTQASYNWATSIGSIKPSGNTASFYSGPTTGKGQVVITATYGTLQKSTVINLSVDSVTTTTYPQTSTSTTPTSTGTTTPTLIPNTSDSISSNIQSDDTQLASCLIHIFGIEKYKLLTTEHQRLTFSDIPKAEQCFARSNYLIPSNLAPIEPSSVKKLKVDSSKAVIEKMERKLVGSQEALVLSGTSKPNQTLLIYIFSEPLVLTTKSDQNGRWTYTLQDPLEGGSHEAYVTVQGDNDQPVRSSGFGFAIATAPKTQQNPLGLSLNLKKNGSNFYYILYIVSASLFVMVSVGIILYLLHHLRKSKTNKPDFQPPSLPNVQG